MERHDGQRPLKEFTKGKKSHLAFVQRRVRKPAAHRGSAGGPRDGAAPAPADAAAAAAAAAAADADADADADAPPPPSPPGGASSGDTTGSSAS